MRQGILAGLLLLSSLTAFATHIVGGSMTYRCVGDDVYEVILTVYTDCLFGQADYDNPAWVAIYDAQGKIVDTLLIPRNLKIDTLEKTDPCFLSIPNVCVRVTQYKQFVRLPYKEGGYTLTYQRCCRNGTINNIIEPIKTGTTYFVHISEASLQNCNRAPIFLKDPPIFVCANEPLVFDNAAFDPDGDSLVYELITPFEGGVYVLNPQPTPPFPPPYGEVIWAGPLYSLSNVLGHPSPDSVLTINPATGLMVGYPIYLGQYVVGVKVSEYRNGELIGEYFRDFQYNVVPCEVTEAAIFVTDTLQCDEFFVQVTNLSVGGDTYEWDFGEPGAISNEFEPSYAYTDTGCYTIRLVVSKGAFCRDTAYAEVCIFRNSIDICTDIQVPFCEDEIVLQLADCSTDSVSSIIAWDWQVTTADSTYLFNTPGAQLTFTEPTQAIIYLQVTDANGCQSSREDTVQLNLINPPPLVPDTVNLCYLEDAQLNPNFDPSLFHQWSPPTGIQGSVQQPNPVIIGLESTLYTVTYTDSTGLCQVTKEVLLTVEDDFPEMEMVLSIPECIDSLVLIASIDTLHPDVTIHWEVTSEQGVYVGGGASIEVLYFTSQLVEVCLTLTTPGCEERICDTVQVNVIPAFTLVDTLIICEGDTIQLNPLGPPELVYQWTPPTFLNDPAQSNPLAWPSQTITYTVVYTDTVGLCVNQDSVHVVVNDASKKMDWTFDVLCDGLEVVFTNLSEGVTLFNWDFGVPGVDTDTSSLASPTFTFPGPGTYVVMLSTPESDVCPGRDTISKQIVLEEPLNIAEFTFDFEQCGNPTIIQFYGSAVSTYGDLDGWNWDFGPFGTSTEQNPVLVITSSATVTASLYLSWDNLCFDTITQVLVVEVFDLELPDLITVCNDSCFQVQSVADPAWFFTWSPASWVDDIHSPNPLVCPDGPGLLTVEVQIVLPGGDSCVLRDTIAVSLDDCDWECEEFVPEVMSCLDTVQLIIGVCDSVFSVLWCSPEGDTLGVGLSANIPMQPWEFIIIKKFGPFGYVETDTVYLFFLEYTVPVTALVDPELIFEGESAQLTAIAPSAVSYAWFPPEDLDNPFIFNPVARPLENTTYIVFVEDALGCRGSDTVQLQVRTPLCAFPYIFVPNTFTPNGDGLNDILYVRGDYIDELEFYVYNRWGELVFETKDKTRGWDGTFKGELLRTDVFGYYLRCICYGQEEYQTRGNVTLLRN